MVAGDCSLRGGGKTSAPMLSSWSPIYSTLADWGESHSENQEVAQGGLWTFDSAFSDHDHYGSISFHVTGLRLDGG